MSLENAQRVISRSSEFDSRRTRYTLYVSWVLLPVVIFFPVMNQYTGFVAQVLLALMAIILVANLIVYTTDWQWGKEKIPVVGISASLGAVLYFAYLGHGEGGSVLWMFTFPLVAMFMLGAFWGFVGSVLSLIASTWILSSGADIGAYPYAYEFTLRYVISYSLLTALAFGFEYWRVALELQKEEVDQELSKTKDLLADLTNVCSWCNSIKMRDNTWVTLEAYVSHKEDTGVSHAICPACVSRERRAMASA